MGCATRGWEYRVLIRRGLYADLDPDWDEDVAPKIFYPAECTLVEDQQHIIVAGTRGSRALFPDQTVRGNRVAGGTLTPKVGRAELNYLQPLITGGEEVADTFKVANTVPWFQVLVDKGQGKFLEYRDCKVSRAMYSASTGGYMTLGLAIVAKKEEEYALTWPTTGESFGENIDARVLRFAESGFAVDYTDENIAVLFKQSQLIVDNLIEQQFYAGDDAATCLDEDRRVVTVALPAAHSSAVKDLYSRGFELLPCRLSYVADNMATRFAMPKVGWPKRGPVMQGEGETILPLQMTAYRTIAGDSGADDELVITNDPVYAS